MTVQVKVISKGFRSLWSTFEDELQEACDDGFQVTHLAAGEQRVVAILEKET